MSGHGRVALWWVPYVASDPHSASRLLPLSQVFLSSVVALVYVFFRLLCAGSPLVSDLQSPLARLGPSPTLPLPNAWKRGAFAASAMYAATASMPPMHRSCSTSPPRRTRLVASGSTPRQPCAAPSHHARPGGGAVGPAASPAPTMPCSVSNPWAEGTIPTRASAKASHVSSPPHVTRTIEARGSQRSSHGSVDASKYRPPKTVESVDERLSRLEADVECRSGRTHSGAEHRGGESLEPQVEH